MFIFKNITACVPGAVIIGTVSILVILLLKYLDTKAKEKIKFPIPAELLCVSICCCAIWDELGLGTASFFTAQ